MNESKPKTQSRLQLVKNQMAQGQLVRGQGDRAERMFISLDNLVPDPDNERKTPNRIDELAASLKEVGQLEPISVTPYSDGKYLILAGWRRYLAAPIAGLSKLEALIRTDVKAEDRAIRGMTSNLQREDTPPIERAKTLKAMLEQFGYSQEKLAKKLGKDKTWMSQMLRILDLPAPLLEKLGAPNFPVSSDTVVRIARIADTAFQGQLVDALMEGAPQKEIREQIKAHKAAKSGKADAPALPKPKRVYKTAHKAIVIVQATTSRISSEQVVLALQEALKIARKDH